MSENAITAVVSLDDGLRTRIVESEGVMDIVQTIEINDADDCQFAVDQRNIQLREASELKTKLTEIINPFNEGIKRVKELFRPAIERREMAVTFLNNLIGGWTEKERKRISVENAQREKMAREAQEKARDEAEKATNDAIMAAAAGNMDTAIQMSAKAAEAEMEASSQVITVESATKLVGNSERKKWVGVLRDDIGPDGAKKLIVLAIADGRSDLLGVIDINEGVINKRAAALRENMNVPGYIAIQKVIQVGRRK